LRAANSYHLKVTATVAGFVVVSEADHVGGEVKGTQSAQGQVTEFVRVRDGLYVKAGASYWSTIVRLERLAMISDRWVKVDPASPTHSSLVQSIDDGLSTATGLTKSGTTMIDGMRVVVLNGDGSTIYVRAQSEPYPVRVEGTTSTEFGPGSMDVDVSQVGAVATRIEPPTGDILDLTTG
jgi:hypothetical protein